MRHLSKVIAIVGIASHIVVQCGEPSGTKTPSKNKAGAAQKPVDPKLGKDLKKANKEFQTLIDSKQSLVFDKAVYTKISTAAKQVITASQPILALPTLKQEDKEKAEEIFKRAEASIQNILDKMDNILNEEKPIIGELNKITKDQIDHWKKIKTAINKQTGSIVRFFKSPDTNKEVVLPEEEKPKVANFDKLVTHLENLVQEDSKITKKLFDNMITAIKKEQSLPKHKEIIKNVVEVSIYGEILNKMIKYYYTRNNKIESTPLSINTQRTEDILVARVKELENMLYTLAKDAPGIKNYKALYTKHISAQIPITDYEVTSISYSDEITKAKVENLLDTRFKKIVTNFSKASILSTGAPDSWTKSLNLLCQKYKQTITNTMDMLGTVEEAEIEKARQKIIAETSIASDKGAPIDLGKEIITEKAIQTWFGVSSSQPKGFLSYIYYAITSACSFITSSVSSGMSYMTSFIRDKGWEVVAGSGITDKDTKTALSTAATVITNLQMALQASVDVIVNKNDPVYLELTKEMYSFTWLHSAFILSAKAKTLRQGLISNKLPKISYIEEFANTMMTIKNQDMEKDLATILSITKTEFMFTPGRKDPIIEMTKKYVKKTTDAQIALPDSIAAPAAKDSIAVAAVKNSIKTNADEIEKVVPSELTAQYFLKSEAAMLSSFIKDMDNKIKQLDPKLVTCDQKAIKTYTSAVHFHSSIATLMGWLKIKEKSDVPKEVKEYLDKVTSATLTTLGVKINSTYVTINKIKSAINTSSGAIIRAADNLLYCYDPKNYPLTQSKLERILESIKNAEEVPQKTSISEDDAWSNPSNESIRFKDSNIKTKIPKKDPKKSSKATSSNSQKPKEEKSIFKNIWFWVISGGVVLLLIAGIVVFVKQKDSN
ncbi:hypothetical protein NEOKW01_1461 [Nematocida sp. AWRm80]|nr:hypothetical protein NEOKW01_1461 [Nematocida sp. AWRm80]